MSSYKKIREEIGKQRQKELDSGQCEVWTMDSFYKGNIQEIRKTMDKLDLYEKAFLYSIATYVGYDDCCLKYDNGNELTMDKMTEISGISKRKLQDVVQGLIDKDILYKGKNSKTFQYFVNPWLFCKGNRINKVLRTMFKNYKIQVKNGTKWKDLRE